MGCQPRRVNWTAAYETSEVLDVETKALSDDWCCTLTELDSNYSLLVESITLFTLFNASKSTGFFSGDYIIRDY